MNAQSGERYVRTDALLTSLTDYLHFIHNDATYLEWKALETAAAALETIRAKCFGPPTAGGAA